MASFLDSGCTVAAPPAVSKCAGAAPGSAVHDASGAAAPTPCCENACTLFCAMYAGVGALTSGVAVIHESRCSGAAALISPLHRSSAAGWGLL